MPVDPTASLRGVRNVTIGSDDCVGPFAVLSARDGASISLANGSNVANNVEFIAKGQLVDVPIGEQVIVAHNATVEGPATIGAQGDEPTFCPCAMSFTSMNF